MLSSEQLHAQHMKAQVYRRLLSPWMSLFIAGEVASKFGAVDASANPAPTRDQGLVRALAEQSCCIQVRHSASVPTLHASCIASDVDMVGGRCSVTHCIIGQLRSTLHRAASTLNGRILPAAHVAPSMLRSSVPL
jgi:hypothetical protein